MGSDLGDFIKQFPYQYLLYVVVLGALYIGLMIVIVRRARKRRRLARGELPPVKAPATTDRVSPFGFLRGQLPDRPLKPAAWTVPSELRGMPEPDLDMLTAPALFAEPDAAQLMGEMTPSTPASSDPATTSTTSPVANTQYEWLTTAITPQEDNKPMPKALSTNQTSDTNNAPPDAVEVMRIWRDLNDGSLIIQMGNTRYRAVSEIQNPDLVRRFTTVVRELWSMVGNPGKRVNDALPNNPDPGLDGSTDLTNLSTPALNTGMYGMQTRAARMLSAEPEPPAANKGGILGRGRKPDPKEAPGGVGIAGAVETFLQNKLAVTPGFSTRSMHIRPSHDHGIKIEVDSHYYDSIDEVADADAREFLFTVMREWEARQ